MEMHQVRYFLALSETLNFTRAAEQCNVTQPSLTRAIRSLEEELGGPLIRRERAKTHLTDLGQLVLPYLESVYQQSQSAKSRARQFTSLKSAAFSMGMMCTIGPQRLVPLMRGFTQQHPGIDITLKDGNARTLLAMLDLGELDLGLCARPNGIPERFHALPLYSERFLIAVAPGHRFEKMNAVRAKDLDGERYLSRVNCEYGEHMREVYWREGVQPLRPYKSERDDWILAMTRAGLGFSFIAEYCVGMPGLVTRPLVDPEVTRTINLVSVRGRPHSAAVGAFVRHAKTYDWDQATLH